MEGEGGVTRSVIDELHSTDIQGDQMEGESGVPRSLIDELHSSDPVKWKVKVLLLEVSLVKFIVLRCKEIKWRDQLVLLSISLMNFILGISKETK